MKGRGRHCSAAAAVVIALSLLTASSAPAQPALGRTAASSPKSHAVKAAVRHIASVQLKLGEEQTAENLKLAFVLVVGDTRCSGSCPPGEARAAVRVSAQGCESAMIELRKGQGEGEPAAVGSGCGDYVLRIAELSPYPQPGRQISDSEYRLQLEVYSSAPLRASQVPGMGKKITVLDPADGYDVVFHRQVGLGDEVRDARTYREACTESLNRALKKRYQGILNLTLLPSDIVENERQAAWRRSAAEGGNYSCRIGGTYLPGKKSRSAFSNLSAGELHLGQLSFSYARLDGFSPKEMKLSDAPDIAALIVYEAPQLANPPSFIVERQRDPARYLAGDVTRISPRGVRYRVWDEMEYRYYNDRAIRGALGASPDEDATIEILVSDAEVYGVTLMNCLRNGVRAAPFMEHLASTLTIAGSP